MFRDRGRLHPPRWTLPAWAGLFTVCLAVSGSTNQAMAEEARDPFAGAPTGRLYLTLEFKGSGRRDLPNKVEWSRLSASRKLDVELALVIPGPSLAPIIPVGGQDTSSSGYPSGFEAMGKAMKSCDGDEACQQRIGAAFAARMMANPKAMGKMAFDNSRYENWIVDRRGACAKGTAVVEDEGDGVNIAPPSPAAPYRFKRVGQITFPADSEAVIERVCQAEVSVDTKASLLSLRLGKFDFSVPVKLQGQAFTTEKSVPFLEGGSKIEILNQPLGSGNQASGTLQVAKLGSISHNSGSTVAPVSGVLTWRFVRN
ncbi:hypothetical protein [Microvirga rosea]|uniref:hypothetical protein n=1 Tax=Microvirga rosea TaxID=2715425 RepID=UPI001D0A6BFB|nr:hypothetical protein [Microvirga rosea]MCB8819784.1 hypothetical protein [Microvirga rosea]